MAPLSNGFHPVASIDEVPAGCMKWVSVERQRVVLANVAGDVYALRDVCGHKNAPLSRGRLDGCLIECPLHFAKFDVRTGKFVDGPVSADVPRYQVQVAGGRIYVKLV